MLKPAGTFSPHALFKQPRVFKLVLEWKRKWEGPILRPSLSAWDFYNTAPELHFTTITKDCQHFPAISSNTFRARSLPWHTSCQTEEHTSIKLYTDREGRVSRSTDSCQEQDYRGERKEREREERTKEEKRAEERKREKKTRQRRRRSLYGKSNHNNRFGHYYELLHFKFFF